MNWDELATLAADPLVTIGAHTVNHVMLAKVPEKSARSEMEMGRSVIAASLGKRPDHLSYPVGDPSAAGPREFRIAAELGFKTAVTTPPWCALRQTIAIISPRCRASRSTASTSSCGTCACCCPVRQPLCGTASAASTRRERMIELAHQDGVAVVRMADGKANAMSLEFCELLTARFEGFGVHRHAPSSSPAGPNFLGRGRSHPSARWRHAVHSQIPACPEQHAGNRVLLPKTGRRGAQWACHRRRLCAGLRRGPAAHGHRRRAASV